MSKHTIPSDALSTTARFQRAVLICLSLNAIVSKEETAELAELALACQCEPLYTFSVSHLKPNPKYLLGTGKLDQIKAVLSEVEADVLILNHDLTPAQERNLEQFLRCHVIDRTRLILEIFATRARSHEGKLQVSLAMLKHQSTRLVRGWTHLERQKGGIGVRGGPGETQLESDKRVLRTKIRGVEKKIERYAKQRSLGRSLRARNAVPVVCCVGYTNAGKSTLFNALTGAKTYVQDQLFATLDTTLRRLALPGQTVVLSDTVGFIRNLPHELIAAFHATLEETREADLLLHVIDSASPHQAYEIAAVEAVLQEIAAAEIPRLSVYNKIDLTGETVDMHYDPANLPISLTVSAKTGAGLDKLKAAIAAQISSRADRVSCG